MAKVLSGFVHNPPGNRTAKNYILPGVLILIQ